MPLKLFPLTLFLLSSAAFAATARAEQIYLYPSTDFSGSAFEVNGDIPDLAKTPIAGKVASLRARTGAWLLCNAPNFQGNCLWLAGAQISDLAPWGFAGAISSVRLYQSDGPRFEWPTSLALTGGDYDRHSLVIAENKPDGGFTTLTGDTPDLTAAGIKYPVDGFIITGSPIPNAWQLCTAPNFTGRCLTAVSSIDVMPQLFTDKIASIRKLELFATSSGTPYLVSPQQR